MLKGANLKQWHILKHYLDSKIHAYRENTTSKTVLKSTGYYYRITVAVLKKPL